MKNNHPSNRGYMLCASPRSGSTLLCDMLQQSNVAGLPQSYFRPESINDFAKEWGIKAAKQNWGKDYIEAFRKHSDNKTGCIGVRMMWSNLTDFTAKLNQIYPEYDNDRDLLLRTLSINHYIHLSRSDKIAQAVSLAVATQTGLWHVNADGSEKQRAKPHQQPVYSNSAIASQLKMIEDEADGWEKWFDENQITPLRISYEELAENPLQTFDYVMSYLGCKPSIRPKVRTGKMSSDINQEWRERFKVESASA